MLTPTMVLGKCMTLHFSCHWCYQHFVIRLWINIFTVLVSTPKNAWKLVKIQHWQLFFILKRGSAKLYWFEKTWKTFFNKKRHFSSYFIIAFDGKSSLRICFSCKFHHFKNDYHSFWWVLNFLLSKSHNFTLKETNKNTYFFH